MIRKVACVKELENIEVSDTRKYFHHITRYIIPKMTSTVPSDILSFVFLDTGSESTTFTKIVVHNTTRNMSAPH